MAINKTKTDPKLGKEISDHLTELGVETPSVAGLRNGTTNEEKKQGIIDIYLRSRGKRRKQSNP